jgi:3-deoxy-D-manno-octulosonate 8-phosphate phosphatase (KDO 8-P phosphatase)
MKMALAAGLKVAWISGRTSIATAFRARDLGVRHCYQGEKDKLSRVEALCRRWKIEGSETAAMGDDEPDASMMRHAGFSACPADAAPAAKRAARVVLKNRGGRGAVREFVEMVLARNAKGRRSR